MAILTIPLFCIIYLIYLFGLKILVLFFLSSLLGLFLEYVVGLAYYKTLNKKLWVYQQLSISGYTSLLSIPIWGVAGVIFWLLSKIIGL